MERMTMSNDAYTEALRGLEMLREENAHLCARVADLSESGVELRGVLGAANRTNDARLLEIDQLKARLEVPNCSQAYRKTNDELAAECNRLAKELAAERRTNENLQRGNSKLLTDLSIARGENRLLTNKASTLLIENSKLRNTLRAVKSTVNTVLVSSPLAPREATRAELDYWEAEKNRSES